MGKEVTVVEMLPEVLTSGKPIPFMNKDMLLTMLKNKNVKFVTSSALLKVVDEGAVVIDNKFRQQTIEADTVVTAIGFASNDELFNELYGDTPNVHNVGDSQVATNIMDAIWAANEVALNI
jgi:2-enoate reductase